MISKPCLWIVGLSIRGSQVFSAANFKFLNLTPWSLTFLSFPSWCFSFLTFELHFTTTHSIIRPDIKIQSLRIPSITQQGRNKTKQSLPIRYKTSTYADTHMRPPAQRMIIKSCTPQLTQNQINHRSIGSRTSQTRRSACVCETSAKRYTCRRTYVTQWRGCSEETQARYPIPASTKDDVTPLFDTRSERRPFGQIDALPRGACLLSSPGTRRGFGLVVYTVIGN